MPFYPAVDRDVQPAPVPGVEACRCCPGRVSHSARARRYPSDTTEAEWAVCEPLHAQHRRCDPLPHPQRPGVATLPTDCLPAGAVYWRADRWQVDGCTERIYDDQRARVQPPAIGRAGGRYSAFRVYAFSLTSQRGYLP